MRYVAFWYAMLALVVCIELLLIDLNGRGAYGAVPCAWLSGLLLSYALFSEDADEEP